MLESTVQNKIKAALKKAGWLVRKVILCGDSGWPDLEAFKDGKNVHIECKIPGKQPGPLQKYRHKQLMDQGIEVVVADSLDDVRHLTQ